MRWTNVGLLLAYCIIIIGAGHGAAPMGMLLVMGSYGGWGAYLLSAQGGILLLIVSLFLKKKSPELRKVCFIADALLVLPLFVMLIAGDAKLLFESAIPFGVFLIAQVALLLRMTEASSVSGDSPKAD